MIDNVEKPLVSIVIPTRNRWDDLQKAIDSCLKQEYSPLEILVYDDASDQNSATMVREKYPSAKVYRSEENVGQIRLRNKGFQDAQGEYLFSLDDDSYFNDSLTITKVVDVLEKYPKVAAAALPYFEPKLNRRHFYNSQHPDGNSSEPMRSVANFTACAASFRQEAVREVGGYCEDFFFAFEEDDLSIRLLDRGWDIISIPVTPLIHLFSGIRDREKLHILGPRNSILFIFLNVPLLYLFPKIIKTTVGTLWHGIKIGELRLKLKGVIQAYELCMKYWEKRNPVSVKTWRNFRRLLKQPEPYIPVQSPKK
jgi:glycosyltransferase involved in cell wall biosynthesis